MRKSFTSAESRAKQMYIWQAAFEHLIALLVSGSFLATLTKELGFSDSTTGILSSIISLGCLFQLFSLVIRCRSSKKMVVAMSIANQLLFASLYLIPFLIKDPTAKAAVFIVAIILAYLLYNIAHPKKIAWLMSFVEDSKRGIFTANKEIVSLICGMAFSFLMGNLIDYFSARGQVTGLLLSAGILLVICVFHTGTVLLVPPKAPAVAEKQKFWESLKAIVPNKNVISVATVFILYNIAHYTAVPFYGSYQIHELGFSLTYVAFLSMLGSITRILFSRMWGKYADKHSFARAMEKCLGVLTLAYLCVVFATPKTGKAAFLLYYILNSIAMGGINNAMINLVFENAPPKTRSDALAICQASAGLFGFLTTLAVSPVVAHIQQNNNQLFGFPVYAQQLLSLVGAGMAVITVIFIRTMLKQTRKDA